MNHSTSAHVFLDSGWTDVPVFAVSALAVPGEVVDGLQDLLPLLLVAPLPDVPPALL